MITNSLFLLISSLVWSSPEPVEVQSPTTRDEPAATSLLGPARDQVVAQPEEAKSLIEDGVPVLPLPFTPTRKTN